MNLKKFIIFFQNALKEFNEVCKDTPKKFPKRILATDLRKGFQYKISEVLYVATQVHERSVVLYVTDHEGNLRSFFAPEKYADIFRNNYEDPSEINCHELYLQFNGFNDETKQMNPLLEIIYKGDAQHI